MRCWIRTLLASVPLSAAPLSVQAEGISTHVLDIANGVGRSDVPVTLMMKESHSWTVVGSALTKDNGRIESFGKDIAVEPGTYKMVFDMSGAANKLNTSGITAGADADMPAMASSESFFSEIDIVFNVLEPERDYHIPILLSPYGYSTYLGN